MVTVIEDNQELTTPVNNGVNAGSNDNNERSFQYIKDFKEVNFYRTSSCKPFPEDLLQIVNGQKAKSLIKGTYFVQIVSFEQGKQFSNNNNNQTNDKNSLILTVTDGVTTVKCITNDHIHDLNSNVKPGCKLLLTGVISIRDGLLQLTHENTRFQYGSNTYSRPRPTYKGRGGGSYRPSHEGRRGGKNNTRYDHDNAESNYLKRSLPKNTLMDYMTSLKISNQLKEENNNEHQTVKDNKHRNTVQHYKTNNGVNMTNTLTMNDSEHYYQTNDEQMTYQQDGSNEQLDQDDDPSHLNYRERRNPLPPRLQRAQEERTRRNTNRYLDDLTRGDINGNYHNGLINNHSLSSSSSYTRHGELTSFIPYDSLAGQQASAALHSFTSHQNMLATLNGATPTHISYFPPNSNRLPYTLPGIPNLSFHNQQPSIGPSYRNDNFTTCCYGGPYLPPTYLPPTGTNGFNNDSKNYNDLSCVQSNTNVDENEQKPTNEIQQDENNNDNENKSESLSNEQNVAPSSSSSHDETNNSQPISNEHCDEKRRDSNSNQRLRWKIGDICLAQWSGDREFYVATIARIQYPFCTVKFRDYNTYDSVHISDLKILPHDQPYYNYPPSIIGSSTDMNVLAGNTYFPQRTSYYTPTIDGCIVMPEAPPFPFNSAGTLYMYPSALPSMLPRSTHYSINGLSSFQQSNQHTENEDMNDDDNNYDTNNSNVDQTINSSSPPSKDSNDTSIIDSTTTTVTSVDENQQIQQENLSLTLELRPSSISDAPLRLIVDENQHELITSTENLTSSRNNEQQLTKDEEEQENNSVINSN